MPTRGWSKPDKRVVARVVLIFSTCYVLSLFGWLLLKDYYAASIARVGSGVAARVVGAEVVGQWRERGREVVGFLVRAKGKDVRIDIPLDSSSFTFNAPLTLAVMGAFWPFLRRTRVYVEVLGLLVLVHLLWVFSADGQKIAAVLTRGGFRASSLAETVFWEFLWGFMDNMVIRFEPFLVGVYLYFRLPPQVASSPHVP